MFGLVGFLYAHAVNVEANGKRRTGATGIEHGHATGELFHFGQELLAYSVAAGAFQTGFDDGFFTAEAGFRGDHFAACQNVVAVAAKCGDEKGRRGEFRPSLFRVLVQLTANVDQLIVISAEHVDLLLFKQKRTRKTPFGNRRIKRRRIEMQRCTSAVRDRTRPHSVRKNNRPSAGNEATDGFEKKNTSKEVVAKALLWQRFALSQKFVTPFQLYPCFSNNNKEVIMSACAFR